MQKTVKNCKKFVKFYLIYGGTVTLIMVFKSFLGNIINDTKDFPHGKVS